jgi:hypothetical protein
MTDKEINQLRTEVRRELQSLAPSVYPYFSKLAKNADGLNQAEATVLAYMAKNRVQATAAIAQLEGEYEAG